MKPGAISELERAMRLGLFVSGFGGAAMLAFGSIMIVPLGSVAAGTPIVVLEAMKMEHTVRAPADGVVISIPVTQGQQVDSGAVLAVVQGAEQ